VNVAVIEVGLGGRLDATNVVNPLVTVITSISYDHTNVLGHTLAEIAGEKAGIIKPGVPVISSPQKEEARLVIERVSAERGALLIQVGRDFIYRRQSSSLDGGQTTLVWDASSSDVPPVELNISLLGAHQVENAVTAYAALLAARRRGLEITEEAIALGFRQATWPARFEVLQRDPPVVVDSSHNRDSALRLRQALDEYFPGLPVILVFGASEDKDIDGMFAELMPRAHHLLVTKSIHPRAANPETLERLAAPYPCPVTVVEKLEDALEEALRLADSKALVLITGSIFVAAGCRESWYKRVSLDAQLDN
jgi:dihydrofolate synthase/folylpolyglutamate synthase